MYSVTRDRHAVPSTNDVTQGRWSLAVAQLTLVRECGCGSGSCGCLSRYLFHLHHAFKDGTTHERSESWQLVPRTCRTLKLQCSALHAAFLHLTRNAMKIWTSEHTFEWVYANARSEKIGLRLRATFARISSSILNGLRLTRKREHDCATYLIVSSDLSWFFIFLHWCRIRWFDCEE